MDVGSKEADRGQDAGVEGSLEVDRFNDAFEIEVRKTNAECL